MADIDIKKLEESLEGKKGSEAVALLKSFFDNLSEEQQGAVYADYALLHMKVMNSINQEYKDYLNGVIEKLEQINASESKAVNSLKLKQARMSLS